jgi:MarR family transcriptional regulator, lower aerobic nicotinate degradation pathway regulator
MRTGAASTELSTVLASLGRDAIARVRKAIRPLGLGAQQYLLLTQLRDLGPSSQAELAAAVGLDPSNLAGAIAELVDRQLVDRCRNDQDRRRYSVGLAASGAKLLAQADAAIAQTETELVAGLTTAEQRQLCALLRRVANRIDLCPGPISEADAA